VVWAHQTWICTGATMINVKFFAFVLAPAPDCSTLLQIAGCPYRVVKVVEARSDCRAKWIPIVCVEEKGTALKSKPVIEKVTGT